MEQPVYYFWIRRTRRSRGVERIEVRAHDSHEAVQRLPKCVSWNFATA